MAHTLGKGHLLVWLNSVYLWQVTAQTIIAIAHKVM